LLAGCSSALESPAPTAAPASASASAPVEPAASPTAEESAASPSPEASVPEGFVRVRFRLHLTGGGIPSATFGLEVHEVGTNGSGPLYLCSSHGGAPACSEGFWEMAFDFPVGATVAYRFYQELDPSGSPYLDIFPKEFVVDPGSTVKTQSYDVQP